MTQLITALVAIVVGVGGALALFTGLNYATEQLSETWETRFKPYVFIGPAIAVVGLFLIYPLINTFVLSFRGANGEENVGFRNYQFLFTNQELLGAIWNTVMWIVLVPIVAVAVGLTVAQLADKLKPRWESVSKSMIFLPMAISFVGASTIWLFVYAFRPEGLAQIGLVNGVITALGASPVALLTNTNYNDFLLMFIMVWLQAGFAMVLLSSAIKGVPEETIEAARIDGATELQIFWRVIIPQIRSTIAVVITTILILVLKIFDIVFVMTNGNFGTEVVANRFIKELFTFRQFGRASAIVIALVVATVPVMFYNVARFREQEAQR